MESVLSVGDIQCRHRRMRTNLRVIGAGGTDGSKTETGSDDKTIVIAGEKFEGRVGDRVASVGGLICGLWIRISDVVGFSENDVLFMIRSLFITSHIYHRSNFCKKYVLIKRNKNKIEKFNEKIFGIFES